LDARSGTLDATGGRDDGGADGTDGAGGGMSAAGGAGREAGCCVEGGDCGGLGRGCTAGPNDVQAVAARQAASTATRSVAIVIVMNRLIRIFADPAAYASA